jgi:hypothetical protein
MVCDFLFCVDGSLIGSPHAVDQLPLLATAIGHPFQAKVTTKSNGAAGPTCSSSADLSASFWSL